MSAHPSIPHCTVRDALNALIDQPSHVGHDELSSLVANIAGVVIRNGSLSDSCKRSVIDQLDEMADEIDQDLRNQQAEQLWRERESRDAGFGPSPADRFVAASIAAIRNEPLEMKHG